MRYYLQETSPLFETFKRYSSFQSVSRFQRICRFFSLQDLVESDYTEIKYWHPFGSFDNSPLPTNIHEYYLFRDKVVKFVSKRNERIKIC